MTWWQRLRFTLAMYRLRRLFWTEEEYQDVYYFNDLTTRARATAKPFIYHSMYRKEKDEPVDRPRRVVWPEHTGRRRGRSMRDSSGNP